MCIPRGWPCWCLLLVRECSLSLNRGIVHAVETEGTGEIAYKKKKNEKNNTKKTQKQTKPSKPQLLPKLLFYGKCECLKIPFLSSTGNKQSQSYLWKRDINSYLKIASLLALFSRKMSLCSDLPAGAFSLNLLQCVLRDVVYGNLHLGTIPVKSYAGATGEEDVMHCGSIGLLIKMNK